MTGNLPRTTISRRTALAGTMLAAWPGRTGARQATPAPYVETSRLAGSSLRILTGQRRIPEYDAWFDALIREWATVHDVTVTIDWVPADDFEAAVANEVSLGDGHDLLDSPLPLPQFEPSLRDLTELAARASSQFGAPHLFSQGATFNPTTNVRWGFCYSYEPAVALYRPSLWLEAGYASGPLTTQDLLAGGTWIWNERGVQVGLGLSPTRAAEVTAQSVLWAFGGAIQNQDEQVTIDRPETRAATDSMRAVFQNASTPAVLSWQGDDNISFMRSGFGSYTIDSVAGLRAIQTHAADIAADLAIAPPPMSADGTLAGRSPAMSLPTGMIPAWSAVPETAMALLLHLVANSQSIATQSHLAFLPTYPETFPDLQAANGPLAADPFGPQNASQTLLPLLGAPAWTLPMGSPGPTNALVGEVEGDFMLARVMAATAEVDSDPATVLAATQADLDAMADSWREAGLMGGGDGEG